MILDALKALIRRLRGGPRGPDDSAEARPGPWRFYLSADPFMPARWVRTWTVTAEEADPCAWFPCLGKVNREPSLGAAPGRMLCSNLTMTPDGGAVVLLTEVHPDYPPWGCIQLGNRIVQTGAYD